MKKVLKKIILKLIEYVEKFEYRNLELDEDNIDKKIIYSEKIDLDVKADTGFVNATHIHKTQPYTIWTVKLENGYELECADNHIIFTDDLREIFVKDLTTNDIVYTDKGSSKVVSIEKTNNKISMFDLSINSNEHRYFTNGILSHNTISTSIAILYYCIFNNDKNVMIMANKRGTTNEIIEKIKAIYYELPFFLKPGVSNWNLTAMTFKDTNCKIRSTQAGPEAAIGFTIDLLFVDEMAYIPNNIADKFYKSVVPTVVSINNSKMIFTSTPNGYNLFWDILTKAELPSGDKDKNNFASMRVYWYEVPGRFVTYLRLNDNLLSKFNITKEEVYEYVKKLGFWEEEVDDSGMVTKIGLKMVHNAEKDSYEIHIPNRDEYLPDSILALTQENDWQNPLSDYFRKTAIEREFKKIKYSDIGEISSWKEDAIKDIGSLESFKQEYDLQPLSGASMLFESSLMDKIKNQLYEFKFEPIKQIEDRLFNLYEELTWIDDNPSLFNLANIKNYYLLMSVDICEGLGGDYSVINFFRVMVKPEDEFPVTVKTVYDFFKLEQVGLFHSNTTSVQELGELMYVLCFEVLDENKIGVVVEANNWGNELTKTMREMFNGRNEYSNHIFFRYKHRQNAENTDIGIKLRSQKEKLVKDYQKRIKRNDIIIHNLDTLKEMTTFIKKETNAGNFKYEADSGAKDDIMMTCVEAATAFDNYKYHDMVNDLMETLPDDIKRKINQKLEDAPNIEATDYSILSRANSVANMNRNEESDFSSNPFNRPSSNGNGNGYNNPFSNNPFSSGF